MYKFAIDTLVYFSVSRGASYRLVITRLRFTSIVIAREYKLRHKANIVPSAPDFQTASTLANVVQQS